VLLERDDDFAAMSAIAVELDEIARARGGLLHA